MDKSALRKSLLSQRLALPQEQWQNKSEQLVEHLQQWLRVRKFQQLILYRSFRREPDLSTLAISREPSLCYYPRLVRQEMHFYPSPSQGPFVKNSFGLEEPEIDDQGSLQVSEESVLIIPALALDRKGFRLGYGGGYFDRFLSNHHPITVGVCFDQFLLNTLPHEAHDLPVQHIITESGAL